MPPLLGDVTLAMGVAAHASHMSLTVQGAFKHCPGMKLAALISLGFGDYEWCPHLCRAARASAWLFSGQGDRGDPRPWQGRRKGNWQAAEHRGQN